MIPRLALVALLVAACSPVTISRIGPDLPRRPPGCAIEILDPGRVPDRPHRVAGVVALDNCQDYRAEPCRGWLEDAACELGGHVAWVEDGGRPDSGVSPMLVRVTVAAWVSELVAGGRDDPFAAEMRRRGAPEPDCGDDAGTEPGGEAPERCVE
jgi:hypothetical protein